MIHLNYAQTIQLNVICILNIIIVGKKIPFFIKAEELESTVTFSFSEKYLLPYSQSTLNCTINTFSQIMNIGYRLKHAQRD